jgi:hypothetical protein
VERRRKDWIASYMARFGQWRMDAILLALRKHPEWLDEKF